MSNRATSLNFPTTTPLHKRELHLIVKALKSHVKNLTLCREYLLAIHERIFGDEPTTRNGGGGGGSSNQAGERDKVLTGRAAFNKFILNATGGIAVTLATIDHHSTDAPYLEAALVFLHNLMFFGGKRNARVIAKVSKKNGSRTLLHLVNKNPNSIRVLHPACLCIIALAGHDIKIGAMARLTGALGVLLNTIKSAHGNLPADVMATIVSAFTALSRGEKNLSYVGKKGAVVLAIELISKYLPKSSAIPLVRATCKLLLQLCALIENLQETVREGGVKIALNALYESGSSVETQLLCLELLEVLMKNTEGNLQFQALGGIPLVVNLVVENNQDKKEDALVQLLCQMARFHGETELPIGRDAELSWINPAAPVPAPPPASVPATGKKEKGVPLPTVASDGGMGLGNSFPTVEDGDSDERTPSDAQIGGGDPATSSNVPWIRLAELSPELNGGYVEPDHRLPDTVVLHHVKPFTETRPAPSCPSSLEFVPPLEELLSQSAQQKSDALLLEFRRYTHPQQLIRKVVYDDLPRNQILPNSLLAQIHSQAQAQPQAQGQVQGASSGAQASHSSSQGGTPLSASSSNRHNSNSLGPSFSQLMIQSDSATSSSANYPTLFPSGRNGSGQAVGNTPTAAGGIPTLKFGSNFESGNLKRAIQVFDNEYDLMLHNDVNTSSYVQWFYFSVENALPDVTYKFNIINMEKPSSTFSVGQRPLLFSEKRFTWSGFGWLRAGFSISYAKNGYKRRVMKRKRVVGGNYCTLSFSIRFPYADDRVYIANCYPYTYSDLMGGIKKLQESPNAANSLIVSRFCDSESGNFVPLLTITTLRNADGEESEVNIRERPVCVVSARVHPGESNASFVCKGLIDYLLDNNETAQYLRDNMVWKIIPMLNVDGVANGNHRCCLGGRDLNREFISPSRIDQPTVFYLKAYIRQMKVDEGRTVMLYGDFHGHSRRNNFFTYACGSNPKKFVNGVCVEKVFPKLLGSLVPFFTADGSTYKVERGKRCTGRVVIYRELGVRMSYTLEGSMMGGEGCDFVPMHWDAAEEDGTRRTALARMSQGHFNTGHFASMGAMFARAAMLIHQADSDPANKAGEIISELIVEAKNKAKGLCPIVPPSPPPQGNFAGDEPTQSPMTGSYINSRRGSTRAQLQPAAKIKASKPAAASSSEIAEIVRALLKNGPVQRKIGGYGKGDEAGGDEDDELDGDEDDEDAEQMDDEGDGDGDGDDDPEVDDVEVAEDDPDLDGDDLDAESEALSTDAP